MRCVRAGGSLIGPAPSRPGGADHQGDGVEDHDNDEQDDAGGEEGLAVVAGGVAHLEGDVAGQGADRVEQAVGMPMGFRRP